MNYMRYLIIIACAGLLYSCASVPPPELIDARQAFQQASAGQAAQIVPAELHKAQLALAIAEKAYQDDPKSFSARDLAYIADRKAKLAEALATTVVGNATTAKANKDYQATQTEIVKNTKEDLAASERNSALKTEQIAAEQKAGVDAKARLVKQQDDAEIEARLQKELTDAEAQRVKESTDIETRRVKDLADAEARRLTTIIILEKGKKVVLRGVNFEFNEATLTNESETILTRAYNAMVVNPDVRVEISGHTDNVGNQENNQVLSLKRAQAVKNWLVQKGIASNRMKTIGRGKNEPMSSNETDEGRAENRRIEFYVQK